MKWTHKIVSSATDDAGNPVLVETVLLGAVEFVGSKGIGKDQRVGEAAWEDLPASVMEALLEHGLGQKLGDSYSGARNAAAYAIAGAQQPGEADAAYAARVEKAIVTPDAWQLEACAMFDKAKSALQRGQWAGERGRKAGPKHSAEMLDFFLPHAKREAPGIADMKTQERRKAVAEWLEALAPERKEKAQKAWQSEIARREAESRRIADLDI